MSPSSISEPRNNQEQTTLDSKKTNETTVFCPLDTVYLRLLRGTSDASISFKDLCKLLKTLGFIERVRGDHFIYRKPQIEGILAIQPIGALAKAYQSNRYVLLSSSTNSVTYMAAKNEIIIYWSDEDNAYLAEVPELPGCMADGESYQKALQNAEIIIQEWIETAHELDRPVPEPRGKLMYA
jgi:predicted RNase H-like HicB family nuclease